MSNSFSPSFSAYVAALLLAVVIPQSRNLWVDASGRGDAQSCGTAHGGVRVSRTEVFLGMSKPDGSTVSDAAFQRFVDAEVTPRLPEGFTIVAGNGQFRDPSGAIVKEPARVLVALYPFQNRGSSAGIERIRAAYREAFQQTSVLRVDGDSCAFS
jgi:hypothetical protein